MESTPKSLREDIGTRDDILRLIRHFYGKVRKHELLGPIFNGTITTEPDWEHHFERLTDFWEGNLFGKTHYSGNPILAHQEVDRNFNHSISGTHFDQWLQMWRASVQELFHGQMATFAQQRAEGIAFHLMRRISENRGEN